MRAGGTSSQAASTPGAFMPDGSYNPGAELSGRGRADRFIRQLAGNRGGPLFSPAMAAEAIRAGGQTQAFPNHAQWATLDSVPGGATSWPFAQTSTSAEEAVKRGGIGVGDPESSPRHWCGDLWVHGAEKSCSHPGHQRERDPERLAAMLSGVGAPSVDTKRLDEYPPTEAQLEITEDPPAC